MNCTATIPPPDQQQAETPQGENVAGFRWAVVMTKPRNEALACQHLEQQHFTVYCPQTIKRDRRGRAVSTAPLFPGYTFVGYHAEQSIAPARSTPGVLTLVRFGGVIAEVSPKVIARVRRAEQHLCNADTWRPPYKPGERLRVIAGPLSGLEGLVSNVAEERIVVLMSLMGQQQAITLAPELLQPA